MQTRAKARCPGFSPQPAGGNDGEIINIVMTFHMPPTDIKAFAHAYDAYITNRTPRGFMLKCGDDGVKFMFMTTSPCVICCCARSVEQARTSWASVRVAMLQYPIADQPHDID